MPLFSRDIIGEWVVDTENDGFGLVSSDNVDTADKVFSLEGLDKLSVVLYEDMSYLRFEFMVGSSREICAPRNR